MGLDLGQPLLLTAPREVLYVSLTFFAFTGVLLKLAPAQRARLTGAIRLFAGCLLLHGTGYLLFQIPLLRMAEVANALALLAGAMAMVTSGVVFVFDVLLAHRRPQQVVRDLMVGAGYLGAIFWLLARAGLSLSSLVATSAFLTAALAFGLQDSLGNLMGGVALQIENSIEVGDWIRVEQVVGRVKEIRWRHTALETRNWETLIIPNSMLMKHPVHILGKRTGQAVQLRRWIYFNVNFRVPPSQVIEVVTEALQAGIPRTVASQPPPHCILFDFKESFCQYAVRYFLTDLIVDELTDSTVRIRIHFALARAGIAMSIPATTMFVEEQNAEKVGLKQDREVQRRLEVLEQQELFQTLTDTERRELVAHMRFAPFVKDEAMTRQGMEGHWLYLLAKGSATVHVTAAKGLQEIVATLKAPDFFGEMSLLTGDRRSATVLAVEDAECYRLDREAFQSILQRRPEIAHHLSEVLARRRVELDHVRQHLDAQARHRVLQDARRNIFESIYRIFSLGGQA